MVLRVLVLYIPLPMFWALFDQQVREDKRLMDCQEELFSLKCPSSIMQTLYGS